jgi:hypothetical protein
VVNPPKPAKLPSVGPTALGAEYAPFIYFDGVSTFGVNFGAVQIELAANIIVPDPTGPTGTRTDVTVTAHLRCSPNAAADLKQMIEKALEMLAKSQEPQQQAPSQLH